MKRLPLFFCIVLFLSLIPPFIPNIKAFDGSGGEFGNWSWDGTNKILTIVANASANAGNTEVNAFAFIDITNAIDYYSWSAEYNKSASETQFEFNFRIRIGDVSAITTWFVDSAKQVTFVSTVSGIVFEVFQNGYLRFGVLEDLGTKRTSQGVSIIVLNDANLQSIVRGYWSLAYVYLYSSSFYKEGQLGRVGSYGNFRVWNCLFTKNVVLAPYDHSHNYYNVIIQKVSSASIEALTQDVTSERIFGTDVRDFVYSTATNNWKVSDSLVRGSTYITKMENGWSGNGYLVNIDSDNWATSWLGTSTGEIYRQYEFSLQVQFPNGTKIENASVVISHSGEGGGTDFNGTTDANGEIPLQTLTMGFYNQTGGNSIYSYNPYTLNITYGSNWVYESTFNLTDKTTWLISLVDPSAKIAGVNIPVLFVGVLLVGLIIAFAGYVGYKKKKS